MTIPADPGTGIQDNQKFPIKVSGVTGLHARFKPLYDALNGALDTDNLSAALLALLNNASASVPVGTILPFYDFDGAASFDPDLFKYCDGSLIADPESPINGETLPDLSGRYLVGFGTDGGGDIDSAVWGAAAIGNASHEIDLEHFHTQPSHTHAPGTLKFKTAWRDDDGADNTLQMYDVNGNLQVVVDTSDRTADNLLVATAIVPDGGGTDFFYTAEGEGVTASGGANDTGSALLANQSIQPRSIRVRFIMRYK